MHDHSRVHSHMNLSIQCRLLCATVTLVRDARRVSLRGADDAADEAVEGRRRRVVRRSSEIYNIEVNRRIERARPRNKLLRCIQT